MKNKKSPNWCWTNTGRKILVLDKDRIEKFGVGQTVDRLLLVSDKVYVDRLWWRFILMPKNCTCTESDFHEIIFLLTLYISLDCQRDYTVALYCISEYCRILNTPHHLCLYWNWLNTLPCSSSREGGELGGASQVD
jgi:hypothetical protein